jgi:CRISPR-associated protein Cas6
MIDIYYNLSGDKIAVDNSYHLFSAVCRLWDEVHWRDDISIMPIKGPFTPPERELTPHRMMMRVKEGDLPIIKDLVGKTLSLNGAEVKIERLERINPLLPKEKLFSRLVIGKDKTTHRELLDFAREELARIGVNGEAALVARSGDLGNRDPFVRRTLDIKGVNIVGYALTVDGLSPDDSIRLQEQGIGGRRHFGCGVFVSRYGK